MVMEILAGLRVWDQISYTTK